MDLKTFNTTNKHQEQTHIAQNTGDRKKEQKGRRQYLITERKQKEISITTETDTISITV